MGTIIPEYALENLHLYKYSGVDKSILSGLFLNKFWAKVATLFPRSVAPNAITLTGLILVLVNFATLLYYDHQYLGEARNASGPPQWLYFTWAGGLFLYQTLDACDGKQARRTGMAGPLGELFDHGCDALNNTLEVILCLRALNLTRSWWGVASVAATAANFYLTTWEEFHTGTLFLGVFSGPVEGILIVILIYILTGIYGTSLWDAPFFSLPVISLLGRRLPSVARKVSLKIAFMILSALGLGFNIIVGYSNVYKSLKRGQSAFLPALRLVPFCISVVLHVAFLASPLVGSPGKVLVQSGYMMPYLCVWGLEFAHQVGRIITAHVTKTSFPYWDWYWVWIAALALDGHAERLFKTSPILQATAISQAAVVFFSLGISLYSYGRFCTLVIQDITNYLGIACFTVRKRNARGEWKSILEVEGEKYQ